MSEILVGPRPITCSLRVAAPAATIFELLCNPYRHPEFDGSGTLRGEVNGPEQLQLGSKFGVAMRYLGVLPYTVTNTVIEFEPDRRIAWTHLSKVIWRYELRPIEGGTEITEGWDPSGAPVRHLYGVLGFPARTVPAMMASLERIKDLVEP
jgi:Polyketide cyclase / dehydrase and lipid transport